VNNVVVNQRSFFEVHLPRALNEMDGQTLPEEVIVVFHIHGDVGGSWQVAREMGPSCVGPVCAGPKDCEVRCASEDFMQLVHGKFSARELFFAGKLEIVGDIGLAMRLEKVIPQAA